MTKAKKLLITLPALSSCLCTIMGCKEDKPLDKENIVFNNENIVTRANSFEGLGVEWGTYEDPDKLTSDSWERTLNILQRLNPQVVRCMLNYDWFIVNFDDKKDDDKTNDTWEYNFSNKLMNNTINILRYCDDHDIEVAFGCWNVPGNVRADEYGMMEEVTSDIRWATMTADILEYLIKFQGIRCIKYFVNSNEPNYKGMEGYSKNYKNTFEKWSQGVKRLAPPLPMHYRYRNKYSELLILNIYSDIQNILLKEGNKMKHTIYGKELANMPYQPRPEGSFSPIWRYTENPVINRNPFEGASRVFNSAVIAYEGEFIGVFRADTTTGIPYLYLGRSKDGIHFSFDKEPIIFYDNKGKKVTLEYAYDPRLVELEGTYYIIFCTSNHGPTLGLGKTKDFKRFELIDNPFLPFNRNGVLFPRKINGELDENVTKGTVPTFDGKAPEKASDAQFTYTFTGWSPEVGAVDSDTTYTAQFTSSANTYTIKWVNFDDTVLETDTNVAYGATPTYDGATPTKAGNAENNYVFSGWEPSVKAVDGNATYKAIFGTQKNTYTITWKNADGTVLKTENIEYGATPAYQGAAPTKQGDAEHSYVFDGWEPAVVAVTGNATYTAKFTTSTNKYTVTWKNADGTVLETDANVAYGTVPTYDSANPTKEGDAQYAYAFKGWDKEVVAVTGDVTYTATYNQTVNKYTVTWKNANGLTLEVDNDVAYGATPTYDGSTPVKDADINSPKYRFIGWDKEVVAVTGDVTYTASYAAYADLAMIDDFESYEDTVDLLGGGWDQMIYNSTTNTWSNSGTGAVVSYGTRSEDGEGALRFDSFANNVTYGFGKDIDASFLADKSVNALLFKMMMPSITTVKVKITLEAMDLPDGNNSR